VDKSIKKKEKKKKKKTEVSEIILEKNIKLLHVVTQFTNHSL
jgi:hypothetical protein